MSDYNEKISQLQQRLDKMVEYQGYFDREINLIRSEINVLRATYQKQNVSQPPPIQAKPPVREYVPPPHSAQNQTYTEPLKDSSAPTTSEPQTPPFSVSNYSSAHTQTEKNNLEKFIGENLISKIGIAILIIGVGIGAQYAIDNNWISPLMRIVFGYLTGFGLIGFAVKLKEKYLNFSAVLLSGGMAIMYFITYFAYSYYNLISQISAFSVMLIFTVFTVLAAIIYNRVVIAQIGLVGAYAVPFLLSENTGKVEILFTYMVIINVGILAISAYKYWRSLFYSSFIFTWMTYAAWYLAKYQNAHDFTLALIFLSIFFVIFYSTFLVYKLLKHQTLDVENVGFILSNSFIFYGLGYAILDGNPAWNNKLGFFTIANAFIHFIIGVILKKSRLGDKTVFYLTVILVLTFVSIAFPIQSQGKWTALFWTAEAVALFWIGRTKRISLFENYSFPVMFLAVIGLFAEWIDLFSAGFSRETAVAPIFNKYFVVGIFFVAGFGIINWLNRNKNYESSLQTDLAEIVKYTLSAIFLFALYNVFRAEIGNYFHSETVRTTVQATTQDNYQYNLTNPALSSFNIIWQFNYTMFFLTILAWANIIKFKNTILGFANLVLNAAVTFLFLLIGLYLLSDLRDLYLQKNTEYFQTGNFAIAIRYISIPLVFLLFWVSYQTIKQEFISRYLSFTQLSVFFDLGFYFSLWIIVSSELLQWLDIFGVQDSHKLGLSILWGVYSLFLICLGIYHRKTHLRIGAIVLFSLTLLKLFLYDLSDLGTISKTIVFVSLGILLLIISFLYTKYKHVIFEAED